MDYFKISNKSKLPINSGNQMKEFIPDLIPFEDNKKLLEQVGLAIQSKMPVLLVGNTGTGKTSLVRYLASKTNNCFRRVNHNGGTTVEDIIGKILLENGQTIWIDGVLVESMKKGYWYLADEINAAGADINFVYHSLLDDDGYVVLTENKGEVIRPHENFRFFAAMNPMIEYAGTKELNKALLSRFLVAKTSFPEPKIEEKVLVKRVKIDKEVAEKMVKFAGEIRASYTKDKIGFVLSTRELIMWAILFKIYGKYILSAEISILNKVDIEDYNCVKDVLSLHFKTLDTPKERKKKNIDTNSEMKEAEKVVEDLTNSVPF